MDKPAATGLRAARAALASSALLLPLLAAADSQAESGAGRALRVAAHLDFKIVIPRVLALDLGGDRTVGRTVAVYSTGHDVVLGVSSFAAPAGAPAPSERSRGGSRAGLILSSAARKGIAQDAICAPAPSAAAPASLVCTASTP